MLSTIVKAKRGNWKQTEGNGKESEKYKKLFPNSKCTFELFSNSKETEYLLRKFHKKSIKLHQITRLDKIQLFICTVRRMSDKKDIQ